MNKRIKILWEEATLSLWPEPGQFTPGENDYGLSKFADVLLREYIGLLQEELDRAHKEKIYNENDWAIREAQVSLLTNLIQETKEKFGSDNDI